MEKISRIWIEAELWPTNQWLIRDGNTDVIVIFANGDRWGATFFSYENVQRLIAKNRKTGENMFGAYFWGRDMILVDEVSRKRIEEIVHELMRIDNFELIFRFLDSEEGKETHE